MGGRKLTANISAARRRAPIIFAALICLVILVALTAGIAHLLAGPSPARGTTPDPVPAARRVEIHDNADDSSKSGEAEGDEPETYLNPFTHTQRPNEVTADMTRRYILGVAKQKVHADLKTWFFEMTPERVHWLLDAVEEHEDYVDQDLYVDILTRWDADDFSQAVHDHNAVWTLLDGDVGRADRVATPEEEAAYLASQTQD